jgi:enolase-phosphatase E1
MTLNKIRAIVIDIEGTTSSIDFVYNVLFPYASAHLADFVRDHAADTEVVKVLADAREVAAEPNADTQRTIDIMLDWIANDQKITPLKTLQGKIWRKGFENGEIISHMYPDVSGYLQEWFDAGIELYIYSSGSVEAQQLLFGYSEAGDLQPLLSGYFDTRIGHKREAQSYATIAQEIGQPAMNILFLSDIAEELDAASAADMRTCQLIRDERSIPGDHLIAGDFGEIVF